MTQGDRSHVLTRKGDALAEVEAAVREIGGETAAGLHRHFYVTRADQTVVMAVAPDARIVAELRRHGGWMEPTDDGR